MLVISKTWFEIFSELFVNLAAGWYALVFIEPQLSGSVNGLALFLRFIFGTISLIAAKQFREEAKKS